MSFVSAATALDRMDDHAPESVVAAMLAMLRVLAGLFVETFGAPAALVKGGAVYGKTRERILRWLHDMECVVRRLLLLRATLFPAPASRPAAQSRKSPARRLKEGEALFGPAEDPALWRVYFRMPAPPEPLWMLGGFKPHETNYELGHRIAPDPAAPDLASIGYWADDPRPLAERFEALRRIIEDPDHYAARLAQRLYLWRGRIERRQLFLYAQCASMPIANEAGLPDADWDCVAAARPMLQALIPVFSEPPRAPSPPPPDST